MLRATNWILLVLQPRCQKSRKTAEAPFWAEKMHKDAASAALKTMLQKKKTQPSALRAAVSALAQDSFHDDYRL